MNPTQIAQLNYLRIAPRKVRLIASVLKGLSINEAEAQLLVSPHRSAEPLLKLLRSAAANAKNNKENKLDIEKLIIKEIRVDKGPMLKRFMPRAQGRAAEIQKKMSHIFLVLEESEKAKSARFKIAKVEKIKKRDAEKIKAALAQTKEKEKEKQIEENKAKYVEKQGFTKRMFRRKSI